MGEWGGDFRFCTTVAHFHDHNCEYFVRKSDNGSQREVMTSGSS